MTDGAQGHGLNELSGHFRGMAHRRREQYLSIYQKTGKDVLESVGPGHA